MHFEQQGTGDTVMLIHGLFGSADNLKTLGRHLSQHYHVVRIDVPNHGLSPKWSQMSYASLAEAIIELLDHLQIDKAHLVGHSMGGKIAMATALSYPEKVSSVIAADISPVAYPRRHDKVFAALTSLPLEQITSRNDAMSHLKHQGIDDGTAMFLIKNLIRNEQSFSWRMNLTGLQQSYDELIGWPSFPTSYLGPALCIRGGDSDYVTAAHRQAYIEQLPNIESKTIAATGHWLHAQKPEIFNRIVADFINKHSQK
ncbi:alpha/beta fold hydrolase [Shewanella waksmanii]|uniref:alpha/beta fold hydrolase n=1 Tax=Shewanella waksmanii TaxID=213783 RepID=UPI003736687E